MDDDLVEPAEFRREDQTVPDDDARVDAKALEALLRLRRQTAITLEGDHRAAKPREHGGRIAGAGADFEHAILRPRRQRLEHQRERHGRRHDLPAGHGERDIARAEVAQPMREKFLARHDFHRAENVEIADARAAQGEKKRAARFVRLRAHPMTSVSAVRASWSVRSSRSGVTEIFFRARASRSVPAPGV